MKKRFLLVLSLFFIFQSFMIFAEDRYYVCVSSFTRSENAEHMEQLLNAAGYKSFCQIFKNNDRIFYRVFVDDSCTTLEQAHDLLEELNARKFFLNLTVSGNFWIAKVSTENKNPTVKEAVEKVRSEENNSLPLTVPFAAADEIPAPEEDEAAVSENTETEIPEVQPSIENEEAEESELPEIPEYEAEPEFPEAVDVEEALDSESVLETETAEDAEVPEEPEPETEPDPEASPAVELETNDEESIPVNEETPYSVLINTYSREQNALNDKDRLAEQDIDSYIIKTFDDESLFSFNLHSGAFENPEDTEELIQTLDELGITNHGTVSWNDYAESVQNYDQVLTDEKVIFEDVSDEMPETMSENVKKAVKQLPVNRNFEIEEFSVFDLSQIIAHEEAGEYAFQEINENLSDIIEDHYNTISSASCALYKDSLYDREVTVCIYEQNGLPYDETQQSDESEYQLSEYELQMSENSSSNVNGNLVRDFIIWKTHSDYSFDTETLESEDFVMPYGTVHGKLLIVDGKFLMAASTDDRSVTITIESEGMTLQQAHDFLEASDNDSSILSYPQVRKNFSMLPETEDNIFIYFHLARLTEEYAEDKDYESWAVQKVGHWCSDILYSYKEKPLFINFFDMDYDYNARANHEEYMKLRSRNESSTNHEIDVNGVEGWYIETFWTSVREISFTVKCYDICLDVEISSEIDADELLEIADQLMVW